LAAVLGSSRSVAYADEDVSALRIDHCGEGTADVPAATGKTAASALYDRGLVLYEEGDYQGAIDTFVKSYCAKPHPASFYNIAQSYERLLKFELSIAYFERYIAESDPAAATTRKATLRAEVLRTLPAQIRVATVPAGAAITIRDDVGLRARGKANQSAPLEVVQGEYTMHVALPGYQPIERAITTKPGQPYSYYLRLEALEGSLKVTATPGDARIFLSDRLVGVGSYDEPLPIGRYDVTVEAPNREAKKQSVQIKPNEPMYLSVELAPPPKSGRRTLLAASGLALSLTSIVGVSSIFKQDDAITLAGSLVVTGLGFGGAYYGIPESTTRGDAWYIIESSLFGFVEGALVGSYFACDVTKEGNLQTQNCSQQGGQAIVAASITGGLLGFAGSAMTHKKFKLDGGDAALLGSAALWGISSGALLYAVFDSDLRIRDPMLFSGLNLGLVAGVGILATNHLSLQRVAIVDLAGLGGVLGGATLAQAFQSQDERIQHFSILGMVSGLVAASFLTRNMDDAGPPKSRSQSHRSNPLNMEPAVGSTIDAAGHQIPNLGISIHL